MKTLRFLCMVLSLIVLSCGITYEIIILQILGALLSFSVWLWEFFLHDRDEKRLSQMEHNNEETDNALNIQRDEVGRVTNNPFDMGEF